MSNTACRRPGLRSAAVIIIGVIGFGAASLAVPAAAAPPSPSPLPGDSPTRTSARIHVEELTPRDVTANETPQAVTIRGRITNGGSARFDAVRLRLQRGAVISTRSELHQSDNDSEPFLPIRSCDWLVLALPDGLPPGRSQPFEYRCEMQTLAMEQIGIYPLVLRAEASIGGLDYEPVGETRTYLPSFPDGVTATTQVSWLWPLVDRPHRMSRDEAFLDDDLAGSVAPGGRLDRLLSIAEHAAPGVRLTLVVDPALIDDLTQMERGYQVHAGQGWQTGRHGDAARSWLDRLKRLARAHTVMALPYGDPDIAALGRVGLTDLAKVTDEDRSLITERLGVEPSTTLVWPPGDVITPTVLDTLVRQGANAVVLNAASLPGQPLTGPTPSSVAALRAPNEGHAVALVPDPDVTSLLQKAKRFSGGPRLAEQRFLTELAMITAEAPSKGRELIVVPPRRWDPDPVSASAMLDDTVSMSWLSSGSAAELARQQPQVDRGVLVYPKEGSHAELPADLVRAVAQAAGRIGDFRTALLDTTSAARTVDPLDATLRLAVSSAWRDDHRTGQRFVQSLLARIEKLRSGVHIVKPSGSGVYSLASPNSPLFLTVANRLDVPVQFKLKITSRGASGFSVGDIGEQVIQAHSRRTIQVPAHVDRAGVFIVDALITSPEGQSLGDNNGAPVELTVRSTAYGVIGLTITGAALALFLLLAIRRLLRQTRGRRRGGGGGGGATTDPTETPARDNDPDGGSMYGEAVAGETTLGEAFDAGPAYVP